jgi:two-component system sensor histidine kinase KdpD
VSHDLRTPLASIRALTTDLRAGVAYDDETRDELLEIVNDEAERLDRLVANLLSLSRIEAGALQPDRQAVALDELVGEVVLRLGRVFEHVTVKDAIPSGLPLVDADYSQIDQVVTNLLENAARHSPAGGTIEVGARALADEVEVWVRDEGPGIDLGHRGELFEPFRRGPGSESSGIGLAICRAIVEAHGGQIDVSNNPDSGATFRFTLPVRHG